MFGDVRKRTPPGHVLLRLAGEFMLKRPLPGMAKAVLPCIPEHITTRLVPTVSPCSGIAVHSDNGYSVFDDA